MNDNILANTNLRIALRVLDNADSTQVIGSKDAAQIPVPLRGRAYARTGPAALTPFQCAWSGAPLRAELVEQPVLGAPLRAGLGPLVAPADQPPPATSPRRPSSGPPSSTCWWTRAGRRPTVVVSLRPVGHGSNRSTTW